MYCERMKNETLTNIMQGTRNKLNQTSYNDTQREIDLPPSLPHFNIWRKNLHPAHIIPPPTPLPHTYIHPPPTHAAIIQLSTVVQHYQKQNWKLQTSEKDQLMQSN